MAQYTYNPTFSEIPLSSFLAPINAIKELFDARRKEYNELNEVYSKLIAAGDKDIREYLAPFEQSRANMANYIAGNRFNQSDMLALAENMRLLWLDKGLKSEAAMTAYYKMKDALAKDPSNIHKSFSMRDFLDNIDFDPLNVSGNRLKALSKEAMESIQKSLLKKIDIKHYSSDYDIAHLYLGLEYGRKMDLIDKVFSDLESKRDSSSSITNQEERSYYDYVKRSMKDIISAEVKDDIMKDEELRNKVFTSLKGGATSLLRQDDYQVLHRPKFETPSGNPNGNPNGGQNGNDVNPSDLILKYFVKNNQIKTKFVINQLGETNNFDWRQIAKNYNINEDKLKYVFDVRQQQDYSIVIHVHNWGDKNFQKTGYFKDKKAYEEFVQDFKNYCNTQSKNGVPILLIKDPRVISLFSGRNNSDIALDLISEEFRTNGTKNISSLLKDKNLIPYKILPSIQTNLSDNFSKLIFDINANATFYVDGSSMNYANFKEKYASEEGKLPLLTKILTSEDDGTYKERYSFTGSDNVRHDLIIGQQKTYSKKYALTQVDKKELYFTINNQPTVITVGDLKKLAEEGNDLAVLLLNGIYENLLFNETNTTTNNTMARQGEELEVKDRNK